MALRYGLWLENFPREYWDKIKALRTHYNLSTRQVLALGLRCALELGANDPEKLATHVETIKHDLSSKPGRPPRRQVEQ